MDTDFAAFLVMVLILVVVPIIGGCIVKFVFLPMQPSQVIRNQAPKVDTPIQAPKVDTPIQAPKVDTPIQAPKVDTPIQAPKVDTPIQAHKVEKRIVTVSLYRENNFLEIDLNESQGIATEVYLFGRNQTTKYTNNRQNNIAITRYIIVHKDNMEDVKVCYQYSDAGKALLLSDQDKNCTFKIVLRND